MDTAVHIRPFEATDREYNAAAYIAAHFPADRLGDFEYQRGAELRAFDESFEGSGHALKRYVAETDGTIVGYAQLFHIPWLREPGRYWVALRMHPAHQRRGIGGRLYQHLLAELQGIGAAAALCEVHETTPALAAYVERQAFHELFRSWPFYLDTRNFDPARFERATERAAARGIMITTLAREQERDSDWLPKLYDLHTTLTRDIPLPGHPHPAPGLEWFRRYAAAAPLALPEAFFIAKDGERYVGESFLHRVKGAPDELNQKATGVLHEYRGAGIALALKLETIVYARQQGYARIWTGVESNNPSMLAINRKLGFVRQPGLILFEKELRKRS
jgi:ribosomal protein S18 acetylase RimI-like enzyme